MTFNTGDEDGTVKLWDARQKPNIGESGSYGKVMEAKPFDEFVSDIYFDANLGTYLLITVRIIKLLWHIEILVLGEGALVSNKSVSK